MQSETADINVDDAILAQRCRNGDSEAMERLILRYQDRIYNVILKICANADDAADLTQETFVRVIENIDKFEGRSGFYTWVFRVAVNLTLSHCKSSRRFGHSSLDIEADDDGARATVALKSVLCDDSSPDPVVIAQNKELCGLILKALMKLDEAHRAVVILRDIEDMNYSQIAEVLSIELGTVKSRLSRARSNLRRILEGMLQ